MTLLCGSFGLMIGYLINRIADYTPRFATNRLAAFMPPKPGAMPAVLQLLAELVSRNGLHPSRSLILRALVELITASFFSFLWLRFGLSWNLLLFGLVVCFLMLIAVIDLRYRLILNVLLFPAAVITLLLGLTLREFSLLSVLLGGGFGLAVFAFAAFIRPGELGAGDVKLATLIGLMFGFPVVIMPLLVGVLAGGIAAFFLLLTRRGNRSTRIPYAPFLCFGALIALFFAPSASSLFPL